MIKKLALIAFLALTACGIDGDPVPPTAQTANR